MSSLKFGGVAALLAAATFIFGFAMYATVLSEYALDDPTPAEAVSFVSDNYTALYVWNFVILILFGIVLVPLVLTLHRRLCSEDSALVPTATAFGLIWAGLVLAAGMIGNIGLGQVDDLNTSDPALAQPVWAAIDAVENGLGGGNEIAGGVWVLLISWAALRAGALPAGLGYLGIVAGAAGLITVIPPLEMVGAIFGIGLIVWFVWLGMTLLREDARRASALEPAQATAR